MAVYRNISLSFWTDSKVDESFTPEDKYFYLYLLTNPHTNLCGCYEISKRQMSIETGYNVETVDRLLARFKSTHKVIDYDPDTKEVLILNWSKYNWTRSEKLIKAVEKYLPHIKSRPFREYVSRLIGVDNLSEAVDNSEKNTVSIPYTYPTDTPVSVSVSDTVSVSVSDTVSDRDKKKRETMELLGSAHKIWLEDKEKRK